MPLPRQLFAPAVALAAVALVLTAPGAASARASNGGATYYVSPRGSDTASGRSSSRPWRTLARASRAHLRPGDRLLLQGGATFTGSGGLVVASSGTSARPVLVGRYGRGRATISGSPLSCVLVSGSWVRLSGIATDHCYAAGFAVTGDHVSLSDVAASRSWAGVQVTRGASYTSVTASSIHDNVRPTAHTPGPDDDSGAFGILVGGDHTTISRNTISRQDVASSDYGRDGSAVEVFGATSTAILDNVGVDNQTFVEIGGLAELRSSDVRLSGNRVSSRQQRTFFAVVHAGDRFGTARGVRADHNHASLTGRYSVGVVCGPRCTPQSLWLSRNSLSAAGGALFIQGRYGGH